MHRNSPSRRLLAAVAVTTTALIGAGSAATLGGVADSASAQPLTSTTTASAPAPTVFSPDGAVDPVAYRAMARSLATAEGIRYRFGTASEGAAATSTAWSPSNKHFNGRGTSTTRTYQIGGPQSLAENDYSSDQGQVGYIPTGKTRTVGVDHIETLSMAENTFSARPRLSWTYYGGGHPEPDVLPSGAAGKCLAHRGLKAGRFVAQARAYAHGEATANSLIAFDNGVIAAAGTNTAGGQVCAKLPAHLRPSAISITQGNEFALVTAWNTATLRSQLVVIALGGVRKQAFWGFEWHELYPGIRNYGYPSFAKVLGSIPLPMAAPTSVSAVSNNPVAPDLLKPDGSRAQLGDLTLSNEANRQTFISSSNAKQYATAGYAIVASREEKKVAFIDLQPLFQTMKRAYFGSRATFERTVANIGTATGKFPLAFSAQPSERPVVVRTVSTASAPSAVAGLLSGGASPRAYVATADGTLHVFRVTTLATTRPASPGSITQVGTIRVGANPTDITYVKDRATGDAIKQTLDNTVIVTARGSRAIQWVRLRGNHGSVIRTLRDSRLVDPIAAEDNNTHGTESYVLSIADYGAKALLNYRYGPVIFRTNGGARFGMGASGSARFEFNGAYRPGGRPFSISVTNVS